jgi:hypothetical protein
VGTSVAGVISLSGFGGLSGDDGDRAERDIFLLTRTAGPQPLTVKQPVTNTTRSHVPTGTPSKRNVLPRIVALSTTA